MKSLKPSMKENKRYLEVRGKIREIEKAILDFIGVEGLSKCGLSFIKKSENSAIICLNREAVDIVRASFVVWKNNIEVLRVSGTLKGLEK